MGLRDIDLAKGSGAATDLGAALGEIAVPALAGLGVIGVVVADLPEIVTVLIVVGVILAVLFASDIILRKSRNFISGIWLIGSTLVKGLDSIYNWEYSLFDWIEKYAKTGFETLAKDIYHMWGLIWGVIFAPEKAIMNRLDSQQSALTTQVNAMQATFASQIAADRLQEQKDVAAINAAATQFKADTLKNFDTVTKAIQQEVTDRLAAIKLITAQLQQEISDRQHDTTALQSNIDSLSVQLGTQIQGLTATVGTLNSTLTGVQTTESTLQDALGTLETTVTQEGTQLNEESGLITGIEAQVAPITATNTATLADLLALSGVALANLIDLADNPCMCLDPIGGSDALYALVAGLEVGIL